MKAITYVRGVLTIISEGNYFLKEVDKPSFITGNVFYYEPTLQLMDGKPLSQELIEKAKDYIDTFVFPKEPEVEIAPPLLYINTNGEFLGAILHPQDGYQVVDEAPDTSLTYPVFMDGVFKESCLVYKDTNRYAGVGFISMIGGTYYAPYPVDTEPFSISYYFYNKDLLLWDISLEDAKTCKINGLMAKQQAEVTEFLGTLAFGEMSSFLKQADEALAWEKDNSLATPFIDKILISRNLGEDRETFLALVLYKSKLFEDFYATNLGKFQGLMKLVDRAVSIDEVKSIVW